MTWLSLLLMLVPWLWRVSDREYRMYLAAAREGR